MPLTVSAAVALAAGLFLKILPQGCQCSGPALCAWQPCLSGCLPCPGHHHRRHQTRICRLRLRTPAHHVASPCVQPVRARRVEQGGDGVSSLSPTPPVHPAPTPGAGRVRSCWQQQQRQQQPLTEVCSQPHPSHRGLPSAGALDQGRSPPRLAAYRPRHRPAACASPEPRTRREHHGQCALQQAAAAQ
jgi:hypothetical protein